MKLRLASITLLAALLGAFVFGPVGTAAAKADHKVSPFKGVQAKGKIGDATVNVTEFAVNSAGALVANGAVTSSSGATLTSFQDVPVTVDQATCSILNLHLAPITLNLLGLVVQTSEINLVITADPTGGLLGSLLCGIANLLNPGTPGLQQLLAQILNRILALLGGSLGTGSPLTGALPLTITGFSNQNGQLMANFYVNGANGQQFGPFATPAQVIQPPEGSCAILDLTLGPIDLTLLGLRVQLYGATVNDPVTILIYAQPGPGNLLGNLLCGLTHLLDSQTTTTTARMNAIVSFMNRILAAAG